MPNPTSSEIYVSRPLTNILVANLLEEQAFAAMRTFPLVPVSQQGGKVRQYDRNDLLRDEARPRVSGNESAGGGFKINYLDYFCDVEAYHHDIPEDVATNAAGEEGLDYEGDATRVVTQKMMIRMERKFFQNFMVSGVWSTERTGVASAPDANQFLRFDVTNSNPKGVVNELKAQIAARSGFIPQTLTMGYQVYLALQSNARIEDQIKYTSDMTANEAALAKFFDVQRVVVSRATVATNREGAAEAYDFIAPKAMLLSYAPPTPSRLLPSAAYLFGWTGLIGSNRGFRTKRIPMPWLGVENRIEGDMAVDMQRVSGECAGILLDVVS